MCLTCRSRADYSVHLVRNEKAVMPVLIETKLSSSTIFEHAIAHITGYYVKYETDAVPPLGLCCQRSQHS